MNKGELLEKLKSFTDDIDICVLIQRPHENHPTLVVANDAVYDTDNGEGFITITG
jgi:hypothetical protein